MSRSQTMKGVAALSLTLVLAAVAVVHLARSFNTRSLLLSAGNIAAQYDSKVGRGVLDAEKTVDSLFVQLSTAQTQLNQLTNRVLEGRAKPAKAPKTLRTSAVEASATKHTVPVQEALDESIEQARKNVDRLAKALRDAEEKLNTKVSLIVDAHSAAKAVPVSKLHATKKSVAAAEAKSTTAAVQGMSPTQGPPMALAHKARASQLAQRSPAGAASGDPAGFTSHAVQRHNVRGAYRKFFQLKAAKQAKLAKEAAEGWDVTPYKDCKGTACHVQLYLDLKTPNVDYTALTGRHFYPDLDKLRDTVKKRGRLSLEYGKVVGHLPKGPGGDGGEPIVDPQGADPAYHFVWQRPGAEHVAIGGHKVNGKRTGEQTGVREYDSRLAKPVFGFDERKMGADYGALADSSKMAAMKKMLKSFKQQTVTDQSGATIKQAEKHQSQGLSGKDVVPAVVQLAREQAALLGLAKKIESVADNRAHVAQKEDDLVHSTLQRLLGGNAPVADNQQQQQQQQQQQRMSAVPQTGFLVQAGSKSEAEHEVAEAEALAGARQPGSQLGIEQAAMKMGRSFLSFLPPKMAEEDVDLFAKKTDPALEPILKAATGASPLLPFGVPGSSGRAEAPVLGNTLTALNGRVAQLEGSLEQSLGLLDSKDQSTIVSKLSKLMGQATAQRVEGAAVPQTAVDGAAGADAETAGMEGPQADSVAEELEGARGRNAPLNTDASKWMQSQESAATLSADDKVLHELEAHDTDVAAATAAMTRIAAHRATAHRATAAKGAAVAARLRAIAAADAREARMLEGQLQHGQDLQEGAREHTLSTLRKQQQQQRDPKELARETGAGAVVPPSSSGVSAAGDVAQGDTLQSNGAQLAESAADKLKADLVPGVQVSGQALSAERQLAATLAREVEDQLKTIGGHAKLALENKLKQVEEGLE